MINPAFLPAIGSLMISRNNPDGSRNLFGSSLGISSMALPGTTNENNFKGMATAWTSNLKLPGQATDDEESSITYDDENENDQNSYF